MSAECGTAYFAKYGLRSHQRMTTVSLCAMLSRPSAISGCPEDLEGRESMPPSTVPSDLKVPIYRIALGAF
jgi:hypothetical protein